MGIPFFVIPAQAGIHECFNNLLSAVDCGLTGIDRAKHPANHQRIVTWIPACAGMTEKKEWMTLFEKRGSYGAPMEKNRAAP